jgi:hypothetical protein
MGIRKSYKDPNLVPANIKSGVSILGTVGTLPNGKQFSSGVTGTITSGTTMNFTNLPFTPTIAILWNTDPTTTYKKFIMKNVTGNLATGNLKEYRFDGTSDSVSNSGGSVTWTSNSVTIPTATGGNSYAWNYIILE